MKVLIACEFSGVVRRAFAQKGHEVWSCDLLDAEDESQFHLKGDALIAAISQEWDLMIAHPPCTYLASSGLHWNKRVLGRAELTEQSLLFVEALLNMQHIDKIALENPIGCISSRIRKPDQIIQPWQFGNPESKATCLWLKGLPLLKPTNILPLPANGRWENQTASGQNKLAPGPDRWKERSRTYQGIADAMAEQWG